jgi:methionine-rich copper-binding protein CopC
MASLKWRTSGLPTADAVTATSPKELRLSFNEELVAKFSRIDLTDQGGKKVEIGYCQAQRLTT